MANPKLPKLTHVLNLRAHMSRDGGVAGKQRNGATRYLAPLTGGFLQGVAGTKAEGLNVEIMPGGSDWLLVDETTKIAHLDVRTHGKTPEGHGFFIYYTGYLGSDDIGQKFRTWQPDAVTSRGGDHHWWTNPTFETSGKHTNPHL